MESILYTHMYAGYTVEKHTNGGPFYILANVSGGPYLYI